MHGWFQLEEYSNSPKTGIKINIDGTKNYQAKSTFRFTDQTASKDASLKDLIVSTGQQDTNPENNTYKKYDLTPNFDKDTFQYELTLLEYIDKMDITAMLSEEKSMMKIKIPKRNGNNELIYEADGTTIVYEEKELQNENPLEITLNQLGEPDTKVTVIVTAEDNKTTNEYTLVIKRPYATIKGRAILADFDKPDVIENYLNIYNIELNHKVTVNLYKTGLADWKTIPDIYGLMYDEPLTYEKLETIPKEITMTSENDGTYTMYVIPGEYDVQVTRLGYLDYIYVGVKVNDGDIIDMGTFNMKAGDANRDGVISQEDINEISRSIDIDNSSSNFPEACNPTQTGVVIAEDLDYANKGQDLELQIVYFND